MIGIKTVVVVALVALATTLGVLDGDLGGERIAALSAASAFAVGLFASTAAALVGVAWRPELASRAALAVGSWPRLAALVDATARPGVRELPAHVQRGLFVLVFAIVALATFDNVATARIASVPANLAEPSHAEYCGLERHATRPEASPAPVVEAPIDQAGCALVKRAYELGYKKDLGSCAPKLVKHESPAIKREREVCTKRQLDEPFLHFMARRLAETTRDASPVDSASSWLDDFKTRTQYVEDFLGDIRHSVTGTPHASHHLWVNLPDPHPPSWLDWLTGHVPCTNRFADLALWPRWTASTPPSIAFEHVLGQLLFATRFGTPASCSDYTIHWGAAVDACARLAASPVEFLEQTGALVPIRAVLDRRRRQLALRALAGALAHPAALPEPPPARFVVSAACFIVGQPARSTGREIAIDGESIAIRELHAPELRTTATGMVELYVRLALLLGGTPYTGPATAARDLVSREPPGALDDASFPLLRLEPLADADPFAGDADSLDDPELLQVFPVEHHLFGFVDAFRRGYLPQRGRL